MNGKYTICSGAGDNHTLTVDLNLEAPATYDIRANKGFALGWGLGQPDADKIGAYIAMYAKKGSTNQWDWGTMSVSSPVSVQ